jgi:hypothetical protein
MRGLIRTFILLTAMVIYQACTPTRLVKPLKKNETAVGAGLGGPLIKFSGAVIPIPYITANAAHGVTDKVSLTGSVHLTSALFGVAQFETGALFSLWDKDSLKQGITLLTNLNTAFNSHDFKLWPQTDLNYYYSFSEKRSVYGGLSCWYEPDLNGPHDTRLKSFIVPSLQFGYLLNRGTWTWQAEAKIIAPTTNNDPVVVDYVTPLGHAGAFGVYFTVAKRFKK